MKEERFISGMAIHLFLSVIVLSGPIRVLPIFLEDGPVDVRYSDIELDEGVYEGEGNINQDPLFEVTR